MVDMPLKSGSHRGLPPFPGPQDPNERCSKGQIAWRWS